MNIPPPTPTRACLTPDELLGYLNNDLDKIHLRQVEEHLAVCPLCSDAVDGYTMLQQQHTTTQTPSDTNPLVLQKIQTSRRAMWISVAAAAILVPLSFVLYWNFTTTDRIYASYGNLYSSSDIAGLDVLRGSDQADPQLNDALYSFNNQAYERAIHKLTTLQSKQASAQRLHLLLGISYLKEKQPDSAIGVLTPLAQNTQFEHHLEAMWHLGMAYLYKGDKKMTLETFRKLAASDSIYAPKAKEILRKLGNN